MYVTYWHPCIVLFKLEIFFFNGTLLNMELRFKGNRIPTLDSLGNLRLAEVKVFELSY
jgi:hypothetical protein